MDITTYKTPAKDDRSAVQRVLKAMQQQGAEWTALENGGEDDEAIDLRGLRIERVMKEVQQTDSDFVHFNFEGESGWLLFVYGNEPYEVVCNWAPADDGPLCKIIERATDADSILIED